MSEIKLKPCPFCGGCACARHNHTCLDIQMFDDRDEYWCECLNCGARSKTLAVINARYRKTCHSELQQIRHKAIEEWNRREGEQND